MDQPFPAMVGLSRDVSMAAMAAAVSARRPALAGLAAVIEAAALVTSAHERVVAAASGAAIPEGLNGAQQHLSQALELLRRTACRTDAFASISQRGAQ